MPSDDTVTEEEIEELQLASALRLHKELSELGGWAMRPVNPDPFVDDPSQDFLISDDPHMRCV